MDRVDEALYLVHGAIEFGNYKPTTEQTRLIKHLAEQIGILVEKKEKDPFCFIMDALGNDYRLTEDQKLQLKDALFPEQIASLSECEKELSNMEELFKRLNALYGNQEISPERLDQSIQKLQKTIDDINELEADSEAIRLLSKAVRNKFTDGTDAVILLQEVKQNAEELLGKLKTSDCYLISPYVDNNETRIDILLKCLGSYIVSRSLQKNKN